MTRCRLATWAGTILLVTSLTTTFITKTSWPASAEPPRHRLLDFTTRFPGDGYWSIANEDTYGAHTSNTARRVNSSEKNSTGPIPLKITNMCGSTIWPAILSAEGTGPGTGGFELKADDTMDLYVGSTWKGRVWGRTNCSFNEDSIGGGEKACLTGDCGGVLDCHSSGEVPATLAEFTLTGGETGMQTFYDISLVDGYNLPLGLRHIASKNTSDIPPNLTNAACIATSGYLADRARTGTPDNTTVATDSSYIVPLESAATNDRLERWCPWPLQVLPPEKPGSGVYPYPDDNIKRPVFDPCFSACAKTRRKQDCCTEEYNDPEVCKPSSYSNTAKSVCPDAYSFAYDDGRSTFIIPKGGGFEVIFCPAGRSTNILAALGNEVMSVAYGGGEVSKEVLDKTGSLSHVWEAGNGSDSTAKSVNTVLVASVVLGSILGGWAL